MDNFLGNYKLLKLNLEDPEDFCLGKQARYWESSQDFSLQTVPGTDGFLGEFFSTFKEQRLQHYLNCSQAERKKECFQIIFSKANMTLIPMTAQKTDLETTSH